MPVNELLDAVRGDHANAQSEQHIQYIGAL